MMRVPRSVAWATRIHGLALRLHPPRFRDEFGDETRADFEALAIEAQERRGTTAVWWLLVRALWDTASTAAQLRRDAGRGGERDREGSRSVHDVREGMMGGVTRDIVIGIRVLARRPVYALVAVGTLTLGVGATTAIFSVVNGVLLKPLPFPAPEELVRVYHASSASGNDRGSFSLPDRRDWVEASDALSALAVYSTLPSGPLSTGQGEPAELRVAYVSAGFFDVLGREALVGRTLRDDEESGDNHVVVLSHAYWQQRFGSDESIVGQSITLDDIGYRVVGVMPPDFVYPSADIEAWIFLTVIPPASIPLEVRGVRFLEAVGRLAPDISVADGTARLNGTAQALVERFPEQNEGLDRAALVPLDESMTGGVRSTLLVLMGVVVLVLLIACANVANLLLARGLERERELSIRRALGAGRATVVRQLLTESGMLALVGGVAGVGLAYWAVPAVLTLAQGLIPRSAEVAVDATVLLFAATTTVATVAVFGVLPALRLTAADGTSRLVSGRGVTGRAVGSRTWSALVGGQVALATVVVIASGLLLRSVWALQTVDIGFDAESVIALHLTMNDARYPEQSDYMGAYEQLMAELRALPGVEAVGSIRFTPLRRDGESGSFSIPGRPETGGENRPQARVVQVSPGFFEAAGVPILAGREFTALDDADASPVVVVNDALRRRYWPGEEVVGQSMQLASAPIPVVGVVGDIRQASLDRDPVPTIYVSQYQNSRRGMTFLIRTNGSPEALLSPVRATVRRIDQDQPIAELAPMTEVVFTSAARPRFFAVLLGGFGMLALLLSSFGIYGVVSHSVTTRVSEIGVRVALGAPGGRVVRMIVGGGLRPVLAGAAVGLIVAGAATRVLSDILFGVSTVDPLTFAAVPLLLVVVAAWASWMPAVRALRIDPTDALRSE